MTGIEGIAVPFVAALLACLMLMPLWIRIARSRRIEDAPGQRRLHDNPTPRGGGVAIAGVILMGLGLLAWRGGLDATVLQLVPGLALFAMLGLLDDLIALPVLAKLLLQLCAAILLAAGLIAPALLGWFYFGILVLACAYVVNIWNFMDGSNGLVASQSLWIAGALALWPGQPDSLRVFAALTAGACAGFLPFNIPRAQVFLGDSGSHVLGAALFALLVLSWSNGSIHWAQAVMLSSAMLFDSGYTLARRALAGKPFWRAHREHLYQIAVRRGHGHDRVCAAYLVWTVFATFLAALAGILRSSWVMASLLIFSMMLGSFLYFGLRKHWLKPGKMGITR